MSRGAFGIGAALSPSVDPKLRASLRGRYGCQVLVDASLRACEAVAARLESSVTPAQIAELALVTAS